MLFERLLNAAAQKIKLFGVSFSCQEECRLLFIRWFKRKLVLQTKECRCTSIKTIHRKTTISMVIFHSLLLSKEKENTTDT